MARGLQGALLRGFGARDHQVTVTDTVMLAPRVVRVRFTAPTVFEDLAVEPTAWLRFWFPDPDGGSTEFQRAYTLSEADETAGTFAVDVVLHEPSGPATAWARTAASGDTLAVMVMGSVGFHVADEPPAGYLLIGDSASLPAINSILEVIPPSIPVECYLETHDADDELIPIREHPRLRLHRVQRHDTGSLAAAVEARDWSNWYAWVGCEAGSLKALRPRLRNDFGFPKTEIHAQAYWTLGREMGKRRGDEPAAVEPAVDSVRPESAVEPAPDVAQAEAVARGNWKEQGAGRLLSPLRTQLILSGVLQAVITLVQLAPFVLLVELSRLLLSGAEPDRLRTLGLVAVGLLGTGTLLGAALTLWLHVVDARFARSLRVRLLDKLSRMPLGWFAARGSAGVKQLVSDDPRTVFIQEELLFPLRQRIQDLQQQLLVNQQGFLTIEMIVRNNKELIRGVNRAQNVTVSALQVAVTLALALANQRIVLEKVQAVTKTTEALIAGTAERLKTQGAEIHKQAAGTALDLDVLRQSFADIRAALDDVSRYRQEALPKMAENIVEMDRMAAESEQTIQRMEGAAASARDFPIEIID